MRRRELIFALSFMPVAGPVLAAGAPTGASGGAFVDLASVALPIAVEGRLVNYVFVQVRVNLTGRADMVKLREKEPYFRDALVRAAHRTPFTRPDDFTKVDEPRLTNAVRAATTSLAGPGLVASVALISQIAKKRTGLPRPSAASGG